MSFIENLEEELNVKVTENDALGYKTTGKALLDFNFKVASYRDKSENEIKVDFLKVWYENKELALKYLFYIRDIREGLGERRLFRTCITEIIQDLDERVFDWITEYGRYDDLFIFFNTRLEKEMVLYVRNKLTLDALNVKEGKPISLLAKWMPSINTSSTKTKKLAKLFITQFGISVKEYRKMLSSLRSYSNVLERQLCENKWNQVNYNAVPSQANLKYNNAFYRHDKERREEYFNQLQKGEAKINSSTTFPHDIVHRYNFGKTFFDRYCKKDDALEAMWKALPDYVKGNSNILVVRDGSGSMTYKIGNSSVTALDVATALAIYFSERCSGQFKDKFITFSSHPEIISLKNYEFLYEKLNRCSSETDCSNTNIKLTFDLVLNTAVHNKLKQQEIPNILIISDMEFDQAVLESKQDKLFTTIENKFKSFGYEMPKLIFWNVCSRTNTIPLKQNKNGVILVSGFSPVITKVVLSNELDPYKALVEELMKDRYKQVTLNNI